MTESYLVMIEDGRPGMELSKGNRDGFLGNLGGVNDNMGRLCVWRGQECEMNALRFGKKSIIV